MVHHMVQEKYQDKLKIIIIQFIMLTYFLSVIMKDPVESDSSVNSDLPDPETSYSLQRRVRCTQGCPNPVLARYMTDHMRRVHRM